ncbi:STAS domain-containing protein [Agromyces sp. GXS1127]|uniref:STAS domain-containing protein n=1 Tax=Agromyces sp. GXS1127 TaxID=3424181 RepID=UPI003D323838
MRETDPPDRVAGGEVLVLQPYGSLFFASAPTLERQLPAVTSESRAAVVIVRLRGTDQIGLAHIEVLRRYVRRLDGVGASLGLVVSEQRVFDQIVASGILADLGEEHLYRGSEWVGEALRRAVADGEEWAQARA